MLVAPPTAPAASRDPRLPVFREIEQRFAGLVVDDSGSDRNLHQHALTFFTRAVAAFSVPPALRRIFRIEAKMQQCIAVNRRDHRDIAAPPAVAAARTAARNVLLPPERHAAIPAVARFDRDSYFID
jgi:hypothetical protein